MEMSSIRKNIFMLPKLWGWDSEKLLFVKELRQDDDKDPYHYSNIWKMISKFYF